MARFIYKANAIAIGGHITRPVDHYIESQAACVLPSTGGKASAKAGPFSLTLAGEFILSFDSAETSLQGEESAPGVHTTLVTTVVRKLNVANTLKADQVIAKLSLSYDVAGKRVSIDTNGSQYVNLSIAGQPFDVGIDHGMSREAADYEAFRKSHPQFPEMTGKIHYALGRHPLLKFDPYEHGYYHHQGFGRIYFGEWTAAPYTQNLSMLRLLLGSPQAGHLEIGGGDGNGAPMPPP